MSTQYHVYASSGVGDPVNYGTVIATVVGLTWDTPLLAASSDWTFAVRAFDTISGLEEQNVDCRVRIALDASQADLTARPNAPARLTARASKGGTARVDWTYRTLGQGALPTGFKIWLTAGPSVNYAVAPALTIAFNGSQSFTANLTGLTDGAIYSIGVRATGASGDDLNTNAVQTTGNTVAPMDVDSFTGAASATGA